MWTGSTPGGRCAHNAGLFARIARQGGCKGIMFDPECYKAGCGTTAVPREWRKGHTFEEYQAKSRERGREFMAAINKEYPDITVLCLYGPASGFLRPDRLDKCSFGLMSSFYAGMLDAASRRESSWTAGSRPTATAPPTRSSTLEGRCSPTPPTLRGPSGVSPPRPLRVRDMDRSRPMRVRLGLHRLLPQLPLPRGLPRLSELRDEGFRRVCLGVYEEPRWWNPASAPRAYVDALSLAKQGPGPGEPHPAQASPAANPNTNPPAAAQQHGYSDEEPSPRSARPSPTPSTSPRMAGSPPDNW